MSKFSSFDLDMLYHTIQKNSVGDDIVLLEDIGIIPQFDFAYPLDRVVITLCRKGWIKGEYDMREVTLKEGELMVLIPDHFIAFKDVSPDYMAFYVMLSKQFATGQRQTGTLKAQLLFDRQPVITLNQTEFQVLNHLMHALSYIVHRKTDDQLEVASELLNLCFSLFHNFDSFRQEPSVQKTRQEEVFERFYELVIHYHRQSREVTFYADKLCITPKYLSSIVKQVTNRSANSWIDQFVIMESKALLKTAKNKTIQEIADEMGFVDQATFSKYFKKHVKQTPTDFRSV